jgi:hypothetical protein
VGGKLREARQRDHERGKEREREDRRFCSALTNDRAVNGKVKYRCSITRRRLTNGSENTTQTEMETQRRIKRNRHQVESPFVGRDNIPKRVESEVLQERISRAIAISHGYARLALRLDDCLILTVRLTAEEECHQFWRRVMLLLLREPAVVLATLNAAPQPSVMPKLIVLLETHVNTRVTS